MGRKESNQTKQMFCSQLSMREVHLFTGHVAYVYWIVKVYVQNSLSIIKYYNGKKVFQY